jgi:hypothetical protein
MKSTAATKKPSTIIVPVENPSIISTPLSPAKQRHFVLEAQGLCATGMARADRGDARSSHDERRIAPGSPATASTERIVRYLTARKLQRKMERRRTDRQKPARGLAIRTIIYMETDPRRLLGLGLIQSSQRQETSWGLVVIAFYPSVECRAVDRIVQRSQPTLSYRSIIPRSIRDLRNRSKDNNAEKKGMQRYRAELNGRPARRKRQHRVSLKPGNS